MDASQVEQNTPDASPGAVGTAGLLVRSFNSIFGRKAVYAALLMLLVAMLAGNLGKPEEKLRDPDIWWHLADARVITTTHRFIRVEPYSFTVAGERWINPEWLSEMPYWLGYRSFGLRGIYLVTLIGLCANLLFVYLRSCWGSRHAGAAFWTAILGFILMTVNDGPRTIVIAYLAMSAEMAILEAAERGQTRLLWLLPPLFCVWINLHGSWLIGLGLLAMYIFCGAFSFKKGVFEQEAFSRNDRNRLLPVFFASLAVLILNPYGWRMIWNPFDMMMNQKLNIANIQEWQPLNLSTILGGAVLLAIALMIVANCIRGRKWKIYELAFIFFAWFAAFDHMRFTFLASVLTIPMLAGDVARSFFAKPNEKTVPALNALLVAGAVWAMVILFPSEAALQKGLAARFPLQTIASIQPSWRTYNQDTLGGMMDFYSKSPMVDTRWDTFEHHGEMQDYLDIMRVREPLKLLDKNRIDHVLIPGSWSLALLLEDTPGWQVARREGSGDDAYVLFARTPGATGVQSQCAAVCAQGNQ
jgi:hypothetical protein